MKKLVRAAEDRDRVDSALVDAGYRVSIIGHSHGGSTAIRVANGVEGRIEIEMVVGVDPVSRGPRFTEDRDLPDDIGSIVLVISVKACAPGPPPTSGSRVRPPHRRRPARRPSGRRS